MSRLQAPGITYMTLISKNAPLMSSSLEATKSWQATQAQAKPWLLLKPRKAKCRSVAFDNADAMQASIQDELVSRFDPSDCSVI